jgi:hypothetical protein
VCENETALNNAMNTVFIPKGEYKAPFVAIIPRHKVNKTLLVKIANMPFGQEDELSAALVQYWSTFGKVVDVKPYKFPGKPWLTKRWDLLLQLPDGVKDLKAPPIFSLDGYTDTIISSWNGAKKACLHCKTAGHSTSKCPLKKPGNQKVGESANPLQKIDSDGHAQKRKEKGSEVSPGSTEEITASSSSTTPATKSATSALPATVAKSIPAPSGEFTVAVPLATPDPPTEATASSPTTFMGSELQQPRPTTPTTSSQLIEDPATPKRGNKRGAKDDEAWTPTEEEVRHYVRSNKICTICCQKVSN